MNEVFTSAGNLPAVEDRLLLGGEGGAGIAEILRLHEVAGGTVFLRRNRQRPAQLADGGLVVARGQRRPLANAFRQSQRLRFHLVIGDEARQQAFLVGFPARENAAFNQDFGVSPKAGKTIDYNYGAKSMEMDEMPGISVFAKDKSGAVYHTYSTYGRGLDMVNAAYHLLDLVPKGRDEKELPYPMTWVRHHDSY